MDFFIQLLINGISLGCIYALLALGFVIIFKASGVINFAMGEFMAVGAYICVTMLTKYELGLILSAMITIVFAIGLAVCIERVILRPLIGEPIISVIMVTVGLASMLKALLIMTFGILALSYPPLVPDKPWLEWGQVFVDNIYLMMITATIASILCLICFFKYSRYGNAMRAVACDQIAALSMGMKVGRLFAVAWSLMAVLAGLGGFLLGSISGLQIGITSVGLKVFPVVILGGLDSIGGAIIGGIIIGIIETFGSVYLSEYFVGGVSEVLPFVCLIIILMVKPYGLFGTEEIEKV